MPPPNIKNLRSQANQSLFSSVFSFVSRLLSSSSNMSNKTNQLQFNSNEMNNFDIDTSGLSAESKEVLACINNLMSRREEKFNCKIELLEKKIGHLEDNLDAQENYSRRDTLVIFGNIPEFTVGKNISHMVQNLICTKLEVDVGTDDISVAFPF